MDPKIAEIYKEIISKGNFINTEEKLFEKIRYIIEEYLEYKTKYEKLYDEIRILKPIVEELGLKYGDKIGSAWDFDDTYHYWEYGYKVVDDKPVILLILRHGPFTSGGKFYESNKYTLIINRYVPITIPETWYKNKVEVPYYFSPATPSIGKWVGNTYIQYTSDSDFVGIELEFPTDQFYHPFDVMVDSFREKIKGVIAYIEDLKAQGKLKQS